MFSLSLLTSTVRSRPDVDKRCFEVVSPLESFMLQAETEAECKEWITVLQNVIEHELNSQTASTVEVDNNNNNDTEGPMQVMC